MSTTPARLLFLDLLRCVACVFVIASHVPFPKDFVTLFRLSRGGWIGVDLFFVLSGFLVSGLLFREYRNYQNVNIQRFLIRRGLKIYPAFYVFLLITVPMVHLIAKDSSLASGWRLASEVLFLQNYWPSFWGHTWSLAVEEHFYIGIALIIGLLVRLRVRLDGAAIPILVLSIAACSLVFRFRMASIPYASLTHAFPTHLRMDSLAFGVLLSYFWNFYFESLRRVAMPSRWFLILVGLLVISPVFIWERKSLPWVNTYGYSLFYLANGAILIGLSFVQIPANRITQFLANLGAQSYSIYLWHAPVANWVVPKFERQLNAIHPLIAPFGAIIASLVLGVVMAKLVELPVLRLREIWFPPKPILSQSPTA